MKIVCLILAVAVQTLSGCMPPPPQRHDPLLSVGLRSSNEDLKRVRLAVVVSENTRKSSEYIRGLSQKAARWGAMAIDETTASRAVLDVLRAAFREVVVSDSAEAAATSGAHLVGVVDIYAKVGGRSFASSTTDIGVEFLDKSLKRVASVRGAGSRKVPYPATTTNWEPSARDAAELFAVALSTNAELAAFAKTLPAPAPAPQTPGVAAAPAAPAAKSYRSDVEAPAFSLPEDPRKFALVVGVENYLSAPAAEHAARDAKTVRAHLRGLGYPERNIVLLTDQQAGKSSLEKYLDAWLPKNTDESSTVAFYFSGHGAPNPDDGQAYLMPWDGDPKFLENTGYPVKRLYERLNALKAKRVLVAMDACFSGSGGRSVIAKGTRPLVGRIDEGRSTAGRVAALTASAADETTGAEDSSGHGLFTYHLLRALNAKGGKATFKQLYDELTPKVRDAARRDNRDQTPQLIGDGAAAL